MNAEITNKLNEIEKLADNLDRFRVKTKLANYLQSKITEIRWGIKKKINEIKTELNKESSKDLTLHDFWDGPKEN